jgi:uncharacterized protein (DUF1697 family)
MRWVALLRAVNLGPRNKVAMAELRRVLETRGCDGVRTYIQSGNVVFDARRRSRPSLRNELEEAITEELGVAATVVLRTDAELASIVAADPFDGTTPTSVTFLAERPPRAAVRRLHERDISPDRCVVVGSDVFLYLPNGVQGARISGAALERGLGVEGTNRGWRTVVRLAELAAAP